MKDLLSVFVGSGLGGSIRYLLSLAMPLWFNERIPFATFVVNVLGCFVLGVFNALLSKYVDYNHLRCLLTIGFCGGFTTFSTFINESFVLYGKTQFLSMCVYVVLSCAVGFGAVFLGGWCISKI